ncbi:hypothetical protein [Arthrobacter sp. D2-10]
MLALVISIIGWAWPFFGLPTPGEASAKSNSARQYFEAVTNSSEAPDAKFAPRITMALAYASPESPAAQYATIRQNIHMANQSVSLDVEEGSVANINGGFEVCEATGPCSEARNLIFDEENRLEDFTLSGIPVASMMLQSEVTPPSEEALQITFKGGLLGDELHFALEVYNRSRAVTLVLEEFVYRDASAEVQFPEVVGLSAIETGQRASLNVRAKGGKRGILTFTWVDHEGEKNHRAILIG